MLFVTIIVCIVAALFVFAWSSDTGKNTPRSRRNRHVKIKPADTKALMRSKSAVN